MNSETVQETRAREYKERAEKRRGIRRWNFAGGPDGARYSALWDQRSQTLTIRRFRSRKVKVVTGKELVSLVEGQMMLHLIETQTVMPFVLPEQLKEPGEDSSDANQMAIPLFNEP